MPPAELFARLGLFVRRGFLVPAECARLRDAARQAVGVPATVWTGGSEYAVDEGTRRTRVAQVPEATAALVLDRLEGLRPSLLAHFGVTAGGWRPLQFLVYRPGDFFRPHADGGRDPGAPPLSRDRRVSVVLFLNDQRDEPETGCYGGGALTFYGLMENPRLRQAGLALTGEAGVLVAFRPDVVHEVTPVTHGVRCTVVTWLSD